MRVARVTTNETCNQNCGFCHARRAREDRDFGRGYDELHGRSELRPVRAAER